MYTLWRHACLVLIAGFAIVTASFVSHRASGAEAPPATASHPLPWSFSPIGHPQAPAVHQNNWPINPIDSFVLGKLEAQRLLPAPRADRLTPGVFRLDRTAGLDHRQLTFLFEGRKMRLTDVGGDHDIAAKLLA